MSGPATKRTKAFISYSHNPRDAKFLAELKTYLDYFEQTGAIQYWDDTKLQSGSIWLTEIEQALKLTKVAILLISQQFLISDFITKKELPALLRAAKEEGATVLCVITSPSLYLNTELAQFQAVNNPAVPLTGMKRHEREEIWVKVATRVSELLQGKAATRSSKQIQEQPKPNKPPIKKEPGTHTVIPPKPAPNPPKPAPNFPSGLHLGRETPRVGSAGAGQRSLLEQFKEQQNLLQRINAEMVSMPVITFEDMIINYLVEKVGLRREISSTDLARGLGLALTTVHNTIEVMKRENKGRISIRESFPFKNHYYIQLTSVGVEFYRSRHR